MDQEKFEDKLFKIAGDPVARWMQAFSELLGSGAQQDLSVWGLVSQLEEKYAGEYMHLMNLEDMAWKGSPFMACFDSRKTAESAPGHLLTAQIPVRLFLIHAYTREGCLGIRLNPGREDKMLPLKMLPEHLPDEVREEIRQVQAEKRLRALAAGRTPDLPVLIG